MKAKSKLMPSLTSDKEAKRFVETADLSNYDLSGFKPMHFEFEPKTAALNMRLPQKLLATLKVKAKAKGIPYSRYVRLLLEKDVDINNNSKNNKLNSYAQPPKNHVGFGCLTVATKDVDLSESIKPQA